MEQYKRYVLKGIINISDYNMDIVYPVFMRDGLFYFQKIKNQKIENFELIVLEECSVEALDDRERYWIQELNSLVPNGYNILIGGQKYRATKTCSICGAPISSKSKTGLCEKHYKEEVRKHIPSKEELLETIYFYNGVFTKVGTHYGVSDNAIRKWCKSYGMSSHSKDYKE